MNSSSSLSRMLIAILQWLGGAVAFVISLVLAGAIVPTPQIMLDAVPAAGILPLGPAMLANAAVNSVILVWAGRRSSLRGVALWLQLLAILFGAQWLATQIETGYFLPAFPMLNGNFEVYRLVLRGLIESAIFTLLIVVLVGGFSRRPRPESHFVVTARRAVRQGAWLAAIYVLLYMLFGYFVAWQSADVRQFYGGPGELNSFLDQWGVALMAQPELPAFQYFRGWVWLLCLIPLFIAFTGGRRELTLLSFLALALLPTIALMFPNPLMPAGVSLAHFWEVSISTGIFGALCAWFVPQAKAAA
jgi:hypothetical protein